MSLMLALSKSISSVRALAHCGACEALLIQHTSLVISRSASSPFPLAEKMAAAPAAAPAMAPAAAAAAAALACAEPNASVQVDRIAPDVRDHRAELDSARV